MTQPASKRLVTEASAAATYATKLGVDQAAAGADQARADAASAMELGRVVYNPTSPDTKTASSTIGTTPANGRADLALDFIAPPTGMVDIEWDAYVARPTSTGFNIYIGMCVILGDVVVPDSKQLLTRNTNDATTPTYPEGRHRYRYRLTGLTPGASYTVHPGMYSAPALYEVRMIAGGVYGPFVGTARAVIDNPSPLGHSYSMASPTTILSDGKVNSFPGATKTAGGTIVVTYCSSTDLLSGGNGLRCIRSTDGGVTWGAPVVIDGDTSLQFGTAAPSVLPDGRLCVVAWGRPTAGGQPVTGAIWYTSSDNGLTWSTRKTVALPASWALAPNWVSESPMLGYGSDLYLCAWGYTGGRVYPEAESGILRSTDGGVTWTRVAFFPNGGTPSRPNEAAVCRIGGRFACVIRDESIHGFWVSFSDNGTTWEAPRVGRGQATGAPRILVKDDIAYWVARYGPDSTGQGHVVGMNKAGKMYRAAHIQSATTTLYGQAVDLGTGKIGVLSSAGVNNNVADLKWSVLTIS